MAANEWFGKFKSRAKLVQETAKNRLDKVSETLNKKLEEARKDLEKQRSEAEASEPAASQLRWRPSSENPDGEIVPEAKPLPIDQSVIQTLPESPQTLTLNVEPMTIVRRTIEKRRSAKKDEQKNSYVKQGDNHEEIVLCLNDIINQIIDREIVDKCSNELIDKISTANESVDNTIFNVMPQKEELILVQDSTRHVENNIDIEKEESTSPKTELYQENNQMNLPTDELTLIANIDNPPIEHSSPENISIIKSDNESPTLTNIEDSPTEHSGPDNIPIQIPDNELPVLTHINDLPIEHSDSENTQMNIPDGELSRLENAEDSPIVNFDPENIPINMSDELLTLANIDDSLNEHRDPEKILINILNDGLSTLTNIDNPPFVDSGSENISNNMPNDDDELPISTSIDDSSIVDSGSKNIQIKIPDDELSTLTKVNEIPTVIPDFENISINTSDDELSTLTKVDEIPIALPDLENILLSTSDGESPTLTKVDEIPIALPDLENIPLSTSDDESPTLTKVDEIPIVIPDLENIPISTSDDELSTLTKVDEIPIDLPDSENIPISSSDDELSMLTKVDEIPIDLRDLENIPISSSDDELSTSTDVDEIPIDLPDSESIPISSSDDELSMLTKVNEIPVVIPDLENIPISTSDDELSTLTKVDEIPIDLPDSENIPISSSDDELSMLTKLDEIPIDLPDLENIPISTSDDELSTSTDVDEIPIDLPGSESIPINTSDGESPTLTKVDEIPIVLPDLENIPINTLDGESPTLTKVDEIPIAFLDLENIPISTSDDELPTLTKVDEIPIVIPDLENVPISSSDDELPTLTKVDEIPIVIPDLKNIPVSTSDDESPALKNINDTSIEHFESEDELPTLTNIVESQIKHSNLDENHSILSENNITPPNELEDSLDELKMSNIPVHRPLEEPPQGLTHLAALRQFLSKIEDDDDADEEPVSSKQDAIILDKNVNTTLEQVNTQKLTKDTLSLSQTSISDDIPENLTNETPVQSDSLSEEPSIDEPNETISTMSIETKQVEKKRFSVVNCHSIPPGTKIAHINCSSIYIYLCTTDRKIFYARLNHHDIYYPFKWQQYSELGERLVVSVTNRTVWRLLNKHLYSSTNSIKFPPLGTQWNEIKIDNQQSLLSMSINDQCGWYIKEDGTLWLIRTDDKTCESLNVACPFNLHTVFCFSEKVGVTTSDGEILIRVGCTNDRLEGDGWIFIEHNFGPIDDFILLTNNNIITIVDKNHRLWIHQWQSDKGFYEILCNDEFSMSHQRYLISVNSNLLCFTDCEKQIHIFSECLIGFQWTVIENNTRLQRLIGAFSDEDYVWALTTNRTISSSNGQILEKPRQAKYLTHATFVPNNSSQDTVLWSLDESCSIYVRANVQNNTQWEQVDQSQFGRSRRLVNIVCNNAGVWAVDDRGNVHFRHGHISASQNTRLDESSFLPPAWIPIPGKPNKFRSFSQIYCGPADWMVYATDNKQNVYTRDGINDENRIGTSWKAIEDCSALELAISEHTLWLLTSCGHIQCRENISVVNPIGTRSTTLPGPFLSFTVSVDDSQVWALDSKRNLLKLDRLTVVFEK